MDNAFPSPRGVWVVSIQESESVYYIRFRPLAGCGLFRLACRAFLAPGVSVPLRGVGCFTNGKKSGWMYTVVSVPLRGVGCFCLGSGN